MLDRGQYLDLHWLAHGLQEKLMSWWDNCGTTDRETAELDRIEVMLGPLAENVRRTRALIGGIEMCHHKAERWVERIIDAIGSGQPGGGLGSRSQGQRHPIEISWASACEALAAWREGQTSHEEDRGARSNRFTKMTSALGMSSGLKRWQVSRVEHRVRSHIGWPENDRYPFMVEPLIADLATAVCPTEYKDDEGFWRETVDTILHERSEYLDRKGFVAKEGYLESADISLAIAIDMLWPCNRNFDVNLYTVLEAIGGQLILRRPFAACARNIRRTSVLCQMEGLCRTLDAYGVDEERGELPSVRQRLGVVTPERKWLADSLAKTIRMQFHISA